MARTKTRTSVDDVRGRVDGRTDDVELTRLKE